MLHFDSFIEETTQLLGTKNLWKTKWALKTLEGENQITLICFHVKLGYFGFLTSFSGTLTFVFCNEQTHS